MLQWNLVKFYFGACFLIGKSVGYIFDSLSWYRKLQKANKNEQKMGGKKNYKNERTRGRGMIKTNINEQGERGGQKVGILDERTFWMTPM